MQSGISTADREGSSVFKIQYIQPKLSENTFKLPNKQIRSRGIIEGGRAQISLRTITGKGSGIIEGHTYIPPAFEFRH